MRDLASPSFQEGSACAQARILEAHSRTPTKGFIDRPLLPHQHPLRFPLEIEVLRLLDRDPDEEDLPTLEPAGRPVLLAHRVGTVGADADAAAEAELARLRLHRPLGDDLIVDVELRGTHRLAVLARLFPNELDSDGVL